MQVETTPAYNFVGEHTDGVTPVPIPNTAVKPVRPMIVPLARKSVIAGILQTGRLELSSRRLFLRASPDSNLAILSILTFIPPYSGHGPHSYRLNSSTGRSQNHPRQLTFHFLPLPPSRPEMDPSPLHSPESIACRITIFIRRWWIAQTHRLIFRLQDVMPEVLWMSFGHAY